MAGDTPLAAGSPQVSDRHVIERELRIITTPAQHGQQLRSELHASWRLDKNRVRGELRRRGARNSPGPAVGHVTVSWRSVAESLGGVPVLGWFARSVQETIPDPAGALSWVEIEIEIDETVFGRPISGSARAETRHTQWIVRAQDAWWDRVAIYRAGVPTPAEFREA
jgi:hypothetical protein